MREILFRGKDIAGNWHYGVPLVFTEDYVCMTAPHTYNKKVGANTIGQFTGLTDKNGNKIFEGDILKIDGSIYYVKFHNGTFGVVIKHGGYAGSIPKVASYVQDFIEIIGNIHDNPELLKEGVNNDL